MRRGLPWRSFRHALKCPADKESFCPSDCDFDHLTTITATGILISLFKKGSLSPEVLRSVVSKFLLTPFPKSSFRYSLKLAQYNFAYQMS